MVRICAVVGCSNSSKKMDKWYSQLCDKHGLMYGSCICEPPFRFFPFPSEQKHPEKRKKWMKLVNRRKEDGSSWEAKYFDRICSKHFREGEPTDAWPDPTENLDCEPQTSSKAQRRAPKERPPHSEIVKKAKAKRKLRADVPATSTALEAGFVPHAEDEHLLGEGAFSLEPPAKKVCPSSSLRDHDYSQSHIYKESSSKCSGCEERETRIKEIEAKLQKLQCKVKQQKTKPKQGERKFDICQVVLKSDYKVNQYTGIQSKRKLSSLHTYLKPKVQKIRYWTGESCTSPRSTPQRKKSNRTPQKSGPSRLLSSLEEFILVLMKLRLALTMGFLGSLFNISAATTSHIFNTWVKFLGQELKHLIVWPDQITTRAFIPNSLKAKYKNLRCTIDCTEVFIERPQNLDDQATTWSDYKHHNTVKFLVAIAPNGRISFLSKAWGGRTSDVVIIREAGFLNLVDPGDVILADRGFSIKEDVLLRHASLHIPLPSKGKEQQTPQDVAKTKTNADARIHVERAIERMKWFSILKETLPVTLVPLIDDIVVVCAALVNLHQPLVK